MCDICWPLPSLGVSRIIWMIPKNIDTKRKSALLKSRHCSRYSTVAFLSNSEAKSGRMVSWLCKWNIFVQQFLEWHGYTQFYPPDGKEILTKAFGPPKIFCSPCSKILMINNLTYGLILSKITINWGILGLTWGKKNLLRPTVLFTCWILSRKQKSLSTAGP